MPSDNKTTYAGYLTVPGASTDPIKSEGDTTIGGDIVKNFKAIGNIIQKNTSGGLNIGGSNSTSSSSGCCIGSSYSNTAGSYALMLGGYDSEARVPYSVNTMYNTNRANINGISGWKGISGGTSGQVYSEQYLGINLNGTGYGIVNIDAIYVDQSNGKSNASYRLVIDYASYIDVLSITLTGGSDSYININNTPRFTMSNGSLYLQNPDNKVYYILSMRYTLLDSAASAYSSTYNSGYNSTYGSYYGSY